jgi:hypothetical protein
VEPDRISGFASPPTVDQFRPVASGSAMRDWPKVCKAPTAMTSRVVPLLPLTILGAALGAGWRASGAMVTVVT